MWSHRPALSDLMSGCSDILPASYAGRTQLWLRPQVPTGAETLQRPHQKVHAVDSGAVK